MSFKRILGVLAVGSALVGCGTQVIGHQSSSHSPMTKQQYYSLLQNDSCPVETCGCSIQGTFAGRDNFSTDTVEVTINGQEIVPTLGQSATGTVVIQDTEGDTFNGTITGILCVEDLQGNVSVRVSGPTTTGGSFVLDYTARPNLTGGVDESYSFSVVDSTNTRISFSMGVISVSTVVVRDEEPCVDLIPN